MQNGQPKLPALLIRFHSQVPAGARPAALAALSWQYSPTRIVFGLAGPAWTARLRGYEALTLLADGRSLRTPGFPSV